MTDNKKAPRKRSTKLSTPSTTQTVLDDRQLAILNAFSDIVGPLMGTNWFGGQQLSQTATLFDNLRWYLVSNNRNLLSQIYVENGLISTVVDVPVDDGLRGGVEIKSDQLSPEEIKKLQTRLDRENLLTDVVGEACKWNRLFGGAGILIITDQPPETPLNLDALKNRTLRFRALDMWELFFAKQNLEGENRKAEIDLSAKEAQFDHYDYYGVKVHKSRVIRMKGLTPPSFIRQQLRGWGFSVVEQVVRSINQYLKSNNLSFEVLDEFKIDVYKIKGLASSLASAAGTASVQRRVALANQQKNFQNALSMDSEDDYQQKQVSFVGVAEIMREIRIQIASDLRMPMTKLFGLSAQGFSSGEDDIENYNAMVESTIRSKIKYPILHILELMCMQEFGYIPNDLSITFKPLRIMSSEQEENVKTQRYNRLLAAKSAGEISSLEFRQAVNKDNLLPIQLDTDGISDELFDDEEDTAEEDDENADNKKEKA